MSDERPCGAEQEAELRSGSNYRERLIWRLLDESRARAAVLEKALEMALIGGNHIACVLIGKLGPGFASLYPPDMPHAEVLELLGAGDEYETWCCWRALMNARANARVGTPETGDGQ